MKKRHHFSYILSILFLCIKPIIQRLKAIGNEEEKQKKKIYIKKYGTLKTGTQI